MRNPFKPRDVTAMQVLSSENAYVPNACYVVGLGVVKLQSLRTGYNVTWSADMVYDMRTGSIRNLANERAEALCKAQVRADVELITMGPARRLLRRS